MFWLFYGLDRKHDKHNLCEEDSLELYYFLHIFFSFIIYDYLS